MEALRPTQEPPREWMTVDEAADLARVDRSAMRQYVRRSAVVSRRIGGHHLVHRPSLLARLEEDNLNDQRRCNALGRGAEKE